MSEEIQDYVYKTADILTSPQWVKVYIYHTTSTHF